MLCRMADNHFLTSLKPYGKADNLLVWIIVGLCVVGGTLMTIDLLVLGAVLHMVAAILLYTEARGRQWSSLEAVGLSLMTLLPAVWIVPVVMILYMQAPTVDGAPTTLPAAGWYPDTMPNAPAGRQRYWDGQQWTQWDSDSYPLPAPVTTDTALST